VKPLEQKAMAWEAFKAGAAFQRPDGNFSAAFARRFPKEAALKQIESDEVLHLAFDAWWKIHREQRAASRRRPTTLHARRSA